MPSTSTLATTASATAAAASRPATDAEAAAPVASKSKAAKATASQKPAATAVRVLVPGLARAPRPVRATTPRRVAVAGYATATTAAKTDPLAFLRDPKLSLEEKLIKLLGYLNAKWEKEAQEKLDKIAAKDAPKTTSTTSSSSKKKGGILGGIASAFAGALGGAGGLLDVLKVPAVKTALKKLGGPVLAAAASALGFPAAAPVLLKYGSTVVDAALGAVSAGGSGGAAKTSQATSTSTSGASEESTQTLLLEVQRLQDKQKEMFGLVSNMLRSNHDTRMSIIGNVR